MEDETITVSRSEHEALRERCERLDRLWRFAWFERECIRNAAYDFWVKATEELGAELDALGKPPPIDTDDLARTPGAEDGRAGWQ